MVTNHKPEIILYSGKSHTEEVYKETLLFLDTHPELSEKIVNIVRAVGIIPDFLPETVTTIMRGYSLPASEAVFEIESSVSIAFMGYYKQAIVSLRSFLELGLLMAFFDSNEMDEVAEWVKGKAETPNLKVFKKRLREIPRFTELNSITNLEHALDVLWKELNNNVHTNGYKRTATSLNKANFVTFVPNSFSTWLNTMENAVNIVMQILLLKFPWGIQSLPVWEKFGLDRPVGWFLNEDEVRSIKKVLKRNEVQVLEMISRENSIVMDILEHVDSLPNKTDLDIELQILQQDLMLARLHPERLEGWITNERKSYAHFSQEEIKHSERNIRIIESWYSLSDYELEIEYLKFLNKTEKEIFEHMQLFTALNNTSQ